MKNKNKKLKLERYVFVSVVPQNIEFEVINSDFIDDELIE
jgi:hypothetical protein